MVTCELGINRNLHGTTQLKVLTKREIFYDFLGRVDVNINFSFVGEVNICTLYSQFAQNID